MKRTGVRLPIPLYEQIREIAKISGYTMNGLIVQILWDFVEEVNKK